MLKQPPVPSVVRNIWRVDRKIGAGSFGQIYVGIRLPNAVRDNRNIPLEVALKFESALSPHPQLIAEAKTCRILRSKADAETIGVPEVYWHGNENGWNIMVMEMLGPSLEELFNVCGKTFSFHTTTMLGFQMLLRTRSLHANSYIHRDIKPENFLMGKPNTSKANVVYMIDYGLTKRYRDVHGRHVPYKAGKLLTGTARYASINTHTGIEQSRRDDLESLGYSLIYFVCGHLPWQGLRTTGKQEKYAQIRKKKENLPEQLFKTCPEELLQFLRYSCKLKFTEKPNYDYLQSLLWHGLYRIRPSLDVLAPLDDCVASPHKKVSIVSSDDTSLVSTDTGSRRQPVAPRAWHHPSASDQRKLPPFDWQLKRMRRMDLLGSEQRLMKQQQEGNKSRLMAPVASVPGSTNPTAGPLILSASYDITQTAAQIPALAAQTVVIPQLPYPLPAAKRAALPNGSQRMEVPVNIQSSMITPAKQPMQSPRMIACPAKTTVVTPVPHSAMSRSGQQKPVPATPPQAITCRPRSSAQLSGGLAAISMAKMLPAAPTSIRQQLPRSRESPLQPRKLAWPATLPSPVVSLPAGKESPAPPTDSVVEASLWWFTSPCNSLEYISDGGLHERAATGCGLAQELDTGKPCSKGCGVLADIESARRVKSGTPEGTGADKPNRLMSPHEIESPVMQNGSNNAGDCSVCEGQFVPSGPDDPSEIFPTRAEFALLRKHSSTIVPEVGIKHQSMSPTNRRRTEVEGLVRSRYSSASHLRQTSAVSPSRSQWEVEDHGRSDRPAQDSSWRTRSKSNPRKDGRKEMDAQSGMTAAAAAVDFPGTPRDSLRTWQRRDGAGRIGHRSAAGGVTRRPTRGKAHARHSYRSGSETIPKSSSPSQQMGPLLPSFLADPRKPGTMSSETSYPLLSEGMSRQTSSSSANVNDISDSFHPADRSASWRRTTRAREDVWAIDQRQCRQKSQKTSPRSPRERLSNGKLRGAANPSSRRSSRSLGWRADTSRRQSAPRGRVSVMAVENASRGATKVQSTLPCEKRAAAAKCGTLAEVARSPKLRSSPFVWSQLWLPDGRSLGELRSMQQKTVADFQLRSSPMNPASIRQTEVMRDRSSPSCLQDVNDLQLDRSSRRIHSLRDTMEAPLPPALSSSCVVMSSLSSAQGIGRHGACCSPSAPLGKFRNVATARLDSPQSQVHYCASYRSSLVVREGMGPHQEAQQVLA